MKIQNTPFNSPSKGKPCIYLVYQWVTSRDAKYCVSTNPNSDKIQPVNPGLDKQGTSNNRLPQRKT